MRVSSIALVALLASSPLFGAPSPSPEEAKKLYEAFVELLRAKLGKVECGIFQAKMRVASTNEGPVTILLDSTQAF